MNCICSLETRISKELLKKNLDCLDTFGKKYSPIVSSKLSEEDQFVLARIYHVFSEIQGGLKQGLTYFPNTEALSAEVADAGLNKDAFIPILKLRSLKFEPFPQVVWTFLEPDLTILNDVQNMNREAFQSLLDKLEFQPTHPLSEEKNGILSHFLFSQNAIGEISFAELVDAWLIGRSGRASFWAGIQGSSMFKITVPKELLPVDNNIRFQEYLIEVTIQYLEFSWGIKMSDLTIRYFRLLFRNESVRSDIAFFSGIEEEFLHLELKNMKPPSKENLQKMQSFLKVRKRFNSDYQAMLLENIFLHNFDPQNMNPEDVCTELDKDKSVFLSPNIESLNRLIYELDSAQIIDENKCVLLAERLSIEMISRDVSLGTLLEYWLKNRSNLKESFKCIYIEAVVRFIFSNWRVDESPEIKSYFIKILKDEKFGLTISYFLLSSSDFSSIKWDQLDLVLKIYLQHLRLMLEGSRKMEKSSKPIFMEMIINDESNCFELLNVPSIQVLQQPYIQLVRLVGIDSFCIPLFCLLTRYSKCIEIIQVFLDLINSEKLKLTISEIYKFCDENRRNLDLNIFKFKDYYKNVLSEFKKSNIPVKNPQALFITPPVSLAKSQGILSSSPQSARKYIEEGHRVENGDITSFREKILPTTPPKGAASSFDV